MKKTMREPNVRVDLTKKDFTNTEQVNTEAKSANIIGIDFGRLFTKKTRNVDGGASAISLASLPVVGSLLSDKISNYTHCKLMISNPGYEVIFYPQYKVKVVSTNQKYNYGNI